MTKWTLLIRRGRVVIDDPQRRCYNGAFFKSHIEWEPWELWLKDNFYKTKEDADQAARLFCRENQEVRAMEVEE